eukprot:jgi/Chlat1/6902/Chrsp52S06579
MWRPPAAYSRQHARRGLRDPYLLMLILHTVQQVMRLERKPPVTLALVALNVAVYYRPRELKALVPSLEQTCLNPHLVVKNTDVRRLLLSAFVHGDEYHLVYNMVSLVWKGIQLENTIGSERFLQLVGTLLLMSHGLVVGVSYIVAAFFGMPEPYYHSCMVGFSAVLFALKIVLNHNSPASTRVMGFTLPTRYACWAELLYIQLVTPRASFIGHLCGILAGLLYVYGSPRVRRWASRTLPNIGSTNSRTYGRGRASTQTRNTPVPWQCSACTYSNLQSASYCQVCGTPRGASAAAASAPVEPVLTADEIRRRRLNRFQTQR